MLKLMEHDDEYHLKSVPLVQDVRDPAMTNRYDSLSENEYLEAVFNEMKAMFNECDFESRKNKPEEIHGNISTALNSLHWPKASSQLHNDHRVFAISQIDFHNHNHRMVAQYEGSFSIKNAVIIAKFAGDENSHSFYIGEHDMLHARVYMGLANDKETPRAIVVDSSNLIAANYGA